MEEASMKKREKEKKRRRWRIRGENPKRPCAFNSLCILDRNRVYFQVINISIVIMTRARIFYMIVFFQNLFFSSSSLSLFYLLLLALVERYRRCSGRRRRRWFTYLMLILWRFEHSWAVRTFLFENQSICLQPLAFEFIRLSIEFLQKKKRNMYRFGCCFFFVMDIDNKEVKEQVISFF